MIWCECIKNGKLMNVDISSGWQLSEYLKIGGFLGKSLRILWRAWISLFLFKLLKYLIFFLSFPRLCWVAKLSTCNFIRDGHPSSYHVHGSVECCDPVLRYSLIYQVWSRLYNCAVHSTLHWTYKMQLWPPSIICQQLWESKWVVCINYFSFRELLGALV